LRITALICYHAAMCVSVCECEMKPFPDYHLSKSHSGHPENLVEELAQVYISSGV
jgi:hypothetical protein